VRSRTAGVMTTLMRNGRDRRLEKPVKCHARKERVFLVGTRSADHIRASGHSGCIQRPDTWLHPNASLKCQIPLAPRAPSIHGTFVWTGRALQAECDDLEMIGLALLYPALERSVCAPGHHGYPRTSDLILRKALKGRWCHQITDATARPFLHLLNPTRRPRQVSWCQGSALGLNPSVYAVLGSTRAS